MITECGNINRRSKEFNTKNFRAGVRLLRGRNAAHVRKVYNIELMRKTVLNNSIARCQIDIQQFGHTSQISDAAQLRQIKTRTKSNLEVALKRDDARTPRVSG